MSAQTTAGHRGRRAWLVAGALSVTAGLVLGGLYLWSWIGNRSEGQHQTYARSAARVEVDTKSVDVTVVAGRSDRVVVDRELRWSFGRPVIREVWDGDVLRISAECPSAPRLPGCSVRYRIEVPRAAAVQARTTSGSLSVTGVDGELRLTTNSGRLTADGVGGALWASAQSGDIVATGLRSETVDVSSTSGRSALGFAGTPRVVTANVRSGDLDLRVPRGGGPYAVLLSVQSGARTTPTTWPCCATARPGSSWSAR
ncbi:MULTISPECIES: DUF4097 family beta strand repeat-containing protein [Saccharothrix]|uniref:DUF4097 family beta strand repeat-containing protein n=1 Tax=Saccharothrix TaxID=2071 RepID=UPI00093F7163|nr:DUF4097 family beta strand repeat-containing protein [Saccharothrix sp. CB00851]OKI26970.1 hypothetical protein A6A25_06925 [Saccharothrix sp. CB00851]